MGIETDKIHKDDAGIVEEFECIICRNFPDDPRQCSNCKKYFCNSCITEWYEKNQICPVKCKPTPIEVKELDPDMLAKYNNIRVLCNRDCGQYIPLSDYVDHTSLCHLPDCSPTCSRKCKYVYNGISTCSYDCLLKTHESAASDPDLAPEKIRAANPDLDLSRFFPVIFDATKSSTELTITSPNSFKSSSTHNDHQTVVSKVGLLGGVHRILFTLGVSERPAKVGVTRTTDVPQNTSFSDVAEGFAFYTVGQTRNDSDGSGMLYGDNLNTKDVNRIIMELAIGEGQMRFKLNDKLYGPAFEEGEVPKDGPFYVAVAVRKAIEETKVEPVNSI